MMETYIKHKFFQWLLRKLIILASLFLCSLNLHAQEKPPRPVKITVNPSQGLIFGAFSQSGSGGTVIISPTGSRSSTGTVFLLNLGFSFSPAILEVDGEPGTIVTIVNGADATLTGTGGGTMTLHLGSSSPISPFVVTTVSPGTTQIKIGGTLTVGSTLASPPGNYSGIFTVTFVQQ